jgi:hypothetical protein
MKAMLIIFTIKKPSDIEFHVSVPIFHAFDSDFVSLGSSRKTIGVTNVTRVHTGEAIARGT